MQNKQSLLLRNQIPKNWQKVKLGEITLQINRGFQPSYTEDNGLTVINQKCIRDGKINLEEARFSNLKKKSISSDKYLEVFDILINSTGTGTVGRVGQVVDIKSPLSFDSHVTLVRPDKTKVSGRYLGYKLWQLEKLFENLAEGSTNQVELGRERIRNLEILLPSLLEQRQIASILSSFDNKIEVNNKIAKTLEEMAQALFKEWFVQFQFPGYEKVKFVDSELGKIPEGWEAKFPDIAFFQEGPGIRNWQYRDSGIPFINIRCFKDGEIDLSDANYLDPKEVEKIYTHFLLNEGDFIVSSSGTLGRIAKVKKYNLPLMLNTSVIRIRPKDGFKGYCFIKYFLRSPYYQNQINAFATGSAQPNYGPSHLKELAAIKPDEELIRKFEDIVLPMERKIDECVGENQKLAALRDLLLPKLMRGEIRI